MSKFSALCLSYAQIIWYVSFACVGSYKIMVDANVTVEDLIRQPSAATFPKGEGKEASGFSQPK